MVLGVALPSRKKALAVAAGAVVVGGGLYFAASKIGAARARARERGRKEKLPVKKGHFLKQRELGFQNMTWPSMRAHDFILLVIASHDEKFQEWAWAEVIAADPAKEKVYVQLRGQLGESSAMPLSTSKHGFRLGTRAFIDRSTIMDRLRPHQADLDEKGTIYCGILGKELTGDEPLSNIVVKMGNDVVVPISTKVAPEQFLDEAIVRIEGISRSSHIIHGVIRDPLDHTPEHGFKQFDKVEFTHDCIFGAS